MTTASNGANGSLRVVGICGSLMRFACLHNAEQALKFLRAWEDAPPNPGGE